MLPMKFKVVGYLSKVIFIIASMSSRRVTYIEGTDVYLDKDHKLSNFKYDPEDETLYCIYEGILYPCNSQPARIMVNGKAVTMNTSYNCHECSCCIFCIDCANCHYCHGCDGCSNCVGCSGCCNCIGCNSCYHLIEKKNTSYSI